MDVYALTRKKRPTQLTLGESTIRSLDSDTTDSSLVESSLDSKINTQKSSSLKVMADIVTGPPSRDHWKPDHEAKQCDMPGCGVTFNLFERRHHCRKCGGIFCSTHCSNYFRLNQASDFHSRGYLSRGCDTCASHHRTWKDNSKLDKENHHLHHPQQQQQQQQQQQHHHHTQRQQEGEDQLRSSAFARRRTHIMTPQPQAMEGVTELSRDDIVQQSEPSRGITIKHTADNREPAFNPVPSVPADWQWSTF